jgi:hypothetical protein
MHFYSGPPMYFYSGVDTPEKALDMMNDFKGHLDLDLVRAFRRFVLVKFEAEATA